MLEIGAELAGRAEQVWKELNRQGGPLLARCPALACGAPAGAGEVEALADRAIACRIPGIGVQALGLLGQAFPDARPRWKDGVPALVEGIAREHWGQRMDVLSVDEALRTAVGDERPGQESDLRDEAAHHQ
jgi:hypothetical protein